MSEDDLRALLDSLDFEAAWRGALADLRARYDALRDDSWLRADTQRLIFDRPDLTEDEIAAYLRELGL